ncbi:hypothetical protein D8770_26140 [Methylobacterium sp. DB1607]|nr:hypothetical protein [Methylobacterium sp. DB1607]
MNGAVYVLLITGQWLLRKASLPFLLIGWIATPILAAAAHLDVIRRRHRPPEWLLRLWPRWRPSSTTQPPR